MTDTTLPSLDAIQARADEYETRVQTFNSQYLRSIAAHESADDVPVLVAALRAVLDLHEDDGHGECSHCPDPSDAHWSAPWPCPTVRAVTAHIDTTPKEKP